MKKSFQAEMDGTQQAISQIVCWCTTIALHQEFGVGKIRLDRITDRMNELEKQNTSVIMTPDANGRPSKQKADSIRESWLAGIVDSDYRVPMIRAPKNRKEEQYCIAGNRAAKIAWQIYAKAVIDVLHYGPDRMTRLLKESRANYEQLNTWGHEDGMDVAMEKLRRCAAPAAVRSSVHTSTFRRCPSAAAAGPRSRLNVGLPTMSLSVGAAGCTPKARPTSRIWKSPSPASAAIPSRCTGTRTSGGTSNDP